MSLKISPDKCPLKYNWIWYEKENDRKNDKPDNWIYQYKIIKSVKNVFDLWQFINNTNEIYGDIMTIKKMRKYNANYYLLYRDGYDICIEKNKNHKGIIQYIVDFDDNIFDIIELLTLEICGCIIDESIYAIKYIVKWEVKKNNDVLKIELWYNNGEEDINKLISYLRKYRFEFNTIDKKYT